MSSINDYYLLYPIDIFIHPDDVTDNIKAVAINEDLSGTAVMLLNKPHYIGGFVQRKTPNYTYIHDVSA
jgi:hypothetical protein